MGLSASQGRMLLLTARTNDLEFRAQQISQKRLILSQQLEEIAVEYENATSNRQMKIALYSAMDSEGNSNVRTTNLTYAALISGAVNAGATKSGIQGNTLTAMFAENWESTTAYRLVNADGAIVVSSENEIPTKVSTTKTTTSKSATTKDNKTGVYTPTIGGASQGNYAVIPQKTKDGKETALAAATKGANMPSSDKVTIYDNGVIEIKGATEADTKYYDKNGNLLDASNTGELTGGINNVTLLNDANKVPKSETTKQESVESNYTIEIGSDGVYSLKDENGVIVGRYIVDESLAAGATDVNGATDGPNYLQDCLRNGKYLLQKGGNNENNEYTWRNLSWDATANISDSYYTDDDDAAKAKYDRLQNQIQAQDKKLELELENIETQRSAVTTEKESVKKVMDENIEGSFKAFA